MCSLQVLFFNCVCFSILLYCTVYAKQCQFDKVEQPMLYININRISSDGNSTVKCIWKESDHKTTPTVINYGQQDAMELKCYRILATTTTATDAILLNTAVVILQWKLQQFEHDLLEVTEKKPIRAGSSSVILNLDRYDDELIARCSSSGNETHNNISVKFKYEENNKEKNVTDINEDIKIVNTTEGQMVPNEFANSVILYNTQGIKGKSRVILSNDNIFDSITLEDNATMYAGWENEGIDSRNITILVKAKWVVFVEPADAGYLLLYLLGIGGISCIVIVTSIIIAVCCKYCRKKSENSIENPYADVYEVAHVQPNQYQNSYPNPEEHDYVQILPQNDRVVYAQIDIRKAYKTTPIQESEPYAEIIGVIRPNKNGQIVKF